MQVLRFSDPKPICDKSRVTSDCGYGSWPDRMLAYQLIDSVGDALSLFAGLLDFPAGLRRSPRPPC